MGRYSVFLKEVVRSCLLIFTNFLFLGADLLRRIQPNLIHRAPVPAFARPALWIPRFRYLMDDPSLFLFSQFVGRYMPISGFFTPVFQSIADPRLPLPTTQRAFINPKNLTGILLAGSPQMA